MFICKVGFIKAFSFLQLQYSTHTVHFRATPLPLSVLSGTFSKWKLESKCQAARQNQFQVSSWTSSIVFFFCVALLVHCRATAKGHIDAIVLCLLWSKRLCTVVLSGDFWPIMTATVHLTSETSAEESSPPSSEPWSRPELCGPTGMVQISQVQKHALLAPHSMCSRVH